MTILGQEFERDFPTLIRVPATRCGRQRQFVLCPMPLPHTRAGVSMLFRLERIHDTDLKSGISRCGPCQRRGGALAELNELDPIKENVKKMSKKLYYRLTLAPEIPKEIY